MAKVFFNSKRIIPYATTLLPTAVKTIMVLDTINRFAIAQTAIMAKDPTTELKNMPFAFSKRIFRSIYLKFTKAAIN